MTKFKHSTTAQDETTRVAFWGTIIQAATLFLAFAAISLLTLSALAATDPTAPQSEITIAYLALAVFATLAIVNISSIVLTIRGKQDLAYELTYFSLIAFVLGAVLIAEGRALTLSFFLLFIAALGIGWICPPRSRRFYLISTVIVFALTWVIEWANPPWRSAYAGGQTIAPFAAAIFAIIFIGVVLRQAWSGNIRVKLVTSFTIVALISTGIVSAVVYISYRNQVREDIRQRLLNIASISAIQLDGDLHATLQTPEDMQKEAYRQLLAQGDEIVAIDPDLIYAYTMRMNEQGQIYFIIDSRRADDPERDAIGTIYDEPSETLQAYFNAPDRPIVEKEIYTDKYGSVLSAFAPFYRADGSLEGIWGVDIAADRIIAQEQAVLRLIVGATLAAMIIVTLIGLFLGNLFTRPILNLSSVAQKFTAGNLDARAKIETTDEIGDLAIAFNTMTSQLQETLLGLEQRVTDRTRDLEIVAEVGTATATILESKNLLQQVVDLTKERFHLYHSHIYLLDDEGKNLVLTAGAGEPGRIMVAEKRSIPLDREQSLVARAARERKGVTVNDVTQAPDFLPNSLLPDTRSELAVPMIVGGNVIGVFDIQSDQVGRFTDADVNIQTTLAAQLATSIQNVRSFEQSKKQAELESLTNAIGQKIQRTTSIEEALQTAIRELGTAVSASRVKANIQSATSAIATKATSAD